MATTAVKESADTRAARRRPPISAAYNKRWEAVALESIFAGYYMGAGITYIPIVYISLFSNNIIHFTHAKYPRSNT